MDAIVEAALKKWPQVPACRGWLGLDARGDWYMRDDRVQRAGSFPGVKGSRIEHLKLREFIERNYAADADGAWYFQNGPQRVYVELEAAPFVWRVAALDGGQDWTITSHNGLPATPRSTWLDDAGRLFADAEIGFGIVHTQDMHLAAAAVEAGRWQPRTMPFASMSARFGFVRSPLAAAADRSAPHSP